MALIYAIWYDKMSALDKELEMKRDVRQKQKQREKSPRTLIRQGIANDIIASIIYLALGGFLAYFLLRPDSEKESTVHTTVLWVICFFFFYEALSPFIKRVATRLGWNKSSSQSESEITVTDEEILRKIEKKMAEYEDDGTIIIAFQEGDIRNALEVYVDDWMTDEPEGTAQLWQIDYERFAITFPCGVSQPQLMEMMFILRSECDDIRLWLPSKVTKTTTGEWTMAIINEKGKLVAASDDGAQWIMPSESDDELLFQRTDTDQVTFQSHPEIDFTAVKKRGLYYWL
ncbi:MAG: hypothetical protein K6A41_00615 [Bacteroidales bacterium]|nr:hypothetical protein [Bacteroidales bacterium]